MRGVVHIDSTGVVEAELGAAAIRNSASACTVAAEATLYYRDDLRSALGLGGDINDDAELILAAYLRWGEQCVDHLEGDFAFVIHDPRDRTLFCARDPYGMRPLYYYHAPGERFVFASDARDVLRHPGVPFALNEGRIADFIVQELEWVDYESTFYQDVYRLPPAYKITINSSGLRFTEYRTPVPGPELRLKTDEDYKEAFLDVFSRAVFERQRSQGGGAGSMLSGGMDSGSIVAIARKPIRAYSLARRRGAPSAECDESRRIYATLDFLGMQGTQVIADEPDSLLDDIGTDFAEPYDGQFLFLKAIYATAKRDGVDVVLDGAAGDIVFHEGAYAKRLLRHGEFGRAWRETVGEQAFWGSSSALPAFLRYCTSAFTPDFARRLVRGPRQRRDERNYVRASLISPEFAQHVDITKRFDRMRDLFSGIPSDDPGLERVRKIRPNLTAGRERYGRIAACVGIEPRDPFIDQRVVDFCSQLPDDQLARDGWFKFLLRSSMAGRLPDMVRWGRGKPHIGAVYNETFLKRAKSRGRLDLDGLLTALGAYVDPGALRRAWQEFEAGTNAESVHRAYVLSLWLTQTEKPAIVREGRIG